MLNFVIVLQDVIMLILEDVKSFEQEDINESNNYCNREGL